MVLVKTFVTYLGLFWFTLTFVKLLAHSIFSVLNIEIENRLYRLTCQLFFGVIVIILVYSVFITHFRTVMLGLIVPLGFGAYYLNLRNIKISLPSKSDLQETMRDILLLLLIATPLLIWEFYQLFDYETLSFKTTFGDYYYYAYTSNCFNHYRAENDYGVLGLINSSLFNGTSPYHYAEIWLNAFVSNCCHIPAMLGLIFITYPLLATIVATSILSLWEVFGELNFWKIILTYLFLVANGFHVPGMEINIVPASFTFYHLALLGEFGQKLLPVYAVLACSLLFYCKGQRLLALYTFALLAFFYSLLLPAVLPSVFLAALVMFYRRKIDAKSFIVYMGSLFCVAAFVFVYYAIYRNKFAADALNAIHPRISEILSHPLNIANYKFITVLMSLIYYKTILSFSPYLPFIFLYIYYMRKNRIKFSSFWWLITFVCLTFSGLMACLWNPYINAVQFYTNALPVLIMLLIYVIVVGISAALEAKNKYAAWLTGAYACIILAVPFYAQFWDLNTSGYSRQYIEQCKDKLIKSPYTDLIGVLRTRQDFSKTTFIWAWTDRPGIFASYYASPSRYLILNLQDAKCYNQPNPEELFTLKQQPIYIYDKYAKRSKSENKDSLLHDFVSQYPVKFIFARKGVQLPDVLYPMLLDSVQDEKSGEICYQLK